MQAVFLNVRAFLKSFHTTPKRILKIGLPIAGLFLFGALFCAVEAPYHTAYFTWMRYAEDFYLCGRDLFSVFILYAFCMETVYKYVDFANPY